MIRIRRATDADTPSLELLFLAARLDAFHWCAPSSFRLSDFSVQTEGEIIHLAEDDETPGSPPLGFISVWLLENFVHHLYVSPGHQRKGIGTQLLGSLGQWLPLPYQLKCLGKNETAIAFYQKHGWTRLSLGSDALGDYLLMQYDG